MIPQKPIENSNDTAFTRELKRSIIDLYDRLERQHVKGDRATTWTSEDAGGITVHAKTSTPVAEVKVAASDSSSGDKALASYVCTGTDDEETIEAAIATLNGVGTCWLYPGNYTCGGNLTVTGQAINLRSKFVNSATRAVLSHPVYIGCSTYFRADSITALRFYGSCPDVFFSYCSATTTTDESIAIENNSFARIDNCSGATTSATNSVALNVTSGNKGSFAIVSNSAFGAASGFLGVNTSGASMVIDCTYPNGDVETVLDLGGVILTHTVNSGGTIKNYALSGGTGRITNFKEIYNKIAAGSLSNGYTETMTVLTGVTVDFAMETVSTTSKTLTFYDGWLVDVT